MNNVKDYRKDELKYYVIGNIFLVILFLGNFSGVSDSKFNFNSCPQNNELLITVISWLLKTGFVVSIGYVFIYLVDAAFSESFKKKLCNRLTKRSKLYYGKIFLDVKEDNFKDKRFTLDQARKKYNNEYTILETLTTDEKKKVSNSFWYRIFFNHINEPTVFITYRDYLLCRDLVVLTILLLPMYLLCIFLFYWLTKQDCCKLSFTLFMSLLCWVFELVLSKKALRAKQKRLAYNVIAVDIHKK